MNVKRIATIASLGGTLALGGVAAAPAVVPVITAPVAAAHSTTPDRPALASYYHTTEPRVVLASYYHTHPTRVTLYG